MLLYFLFTDFRADKKLNVTSRSIDPFSILIFCSENFISPSSILMVYYSFEPFIASKIHGMGISKSHVRSKLFSLVCIMPYFIEIKFVHCTAKMVFGATKKVLVSVSWTITLMRLLSLYYRFNIRFFFC